MSREDQPPTDDHDEDPGTRGPLDGSEDSILGENPDDEAIPASPVRRRAAMVAAMVFIAVILTFLVWFIATNTEQSDPAGMLGAASQASIDAP